MQTNEWRKYFKFLLLGLNHRLNGLKDFTDFPLCNRRNPANL